MGQSNKSFDIIYAIIIRCLYMTVHLHALLQHFNYKYPLSISDLL